ncbi:Ribosomal RNA-processing protein 15 [Elsinoe australis]|uniref:Ribosomal RNA-processing protein 15 n=1 Tax=Elsinoe australis TaxID=40998 RepID=A0A2P7Z383_9PEZI|nr:Ribosomal RNA-processing protein 15 [Elsinoe australis]
MPSTAPKRKRTAEHLHKAKKPKRFRKQKNYHSSSEDEDEDDVDDAGADFAPVNMDDSDASEEVEVPAAPVTKNKKSAPPSKKPEDEDIEEAEDLDDEALDEDLADEIDLEDDSMADDSEASEAESDANTRGPAKAKKRNDPTAFATSMSKILSSKLSTSKRSDPVLSRSVDASTANRELTDSRLELKAKQKLRAERKAALERGRVTDVLGINTEGVSAAEIQEREKRLKKTAQRGVVKLFNAVRAAQVQADVAREQARKEGVVGMAQREERINKMSKKSFLDLIAKGGKKGATIEEG